MVTERQQNILNLTDIFTKTHEEPVGSKGLAKVYL